MTDQPPPTDKKPRRRSAPRKRAPAKRAAKPEADALVASATSAVDTAHAAGDATAEAAERSAASGEHDVAAILDPKPLAEPAGNGDAPVSDPAAAAGERAVSGGGIAAEARNASPSPRDRPAAAPSLADERDASPDASTAADGRSDASPSATAVASIDADTASPRNAPPGAERAKDTTSRARPEPAAAPPAAPDASPMRQDSLRPGELIRVPLSVRWRDLDAFNHVNNSKYLSYLEEARLRWMLTVPGMGMDDDVAPVVAASNLSYRRPIEWPGDVVIELFVERVGGSSLTIGHRIVDAGNGGAVYCDGNVVMVWIDRRSGRSAPLPEPVRAACR